MNRLNFVKRVAAWCMLMVPLAAPLASLGLAFADQSPGGGYERQSINTTWRSTGAPLGHLNGGTPDTSQAVRIHGATGANVYINTTDKVTQDSVFIKIAYTPNGFTWFAPVAVETLLTASEDKLIDLKASRITSQLGFDPTHVKEVRIHCMHPLTAGATDTAEVESIWNLLWERRP